MLRMPPDKQCPSITGLMKIAVYTDGILIPFLFHILRFQVSGMMNRGPETRHTGRNKYGIFFKAIL